MSRWPPRSRSVFGHLRRLAELPERCTRTTPADPRTTFDVFWGRFEENYPFFAATGIDWRAVRDRYRPLVSAQTTDKELQGIFTDMLRPLYDAHTALVADGEVVYPGLRPGTLADTPELLARVDKALAAQLPGPLRTWGGGQLGYAELPMTAAGPGAAPGTGTTAGEGRIGYLRILSFTGYSDGGTYRDDAADPAPPPHLTAARPHGRDPCEYEWPAGCAPERLHKPSLDRC